MVDYFHITAPIEDLTFELNQRKDCQEVISICLDTSVIPPKAIAFCRAFHVSNKIPEVEILEKAKEIESKESNRKKK